MVVRHPWWVILGWVIAAVAIVSLSPGLTSTTDESSFLPTHYESIQAANVQSKAFPQAFTPAAIMVFERQDGSALSDQDAAKVTQVAKSLSDEKIAGVQQIVATPPSTNKLVQTAAVAMADSTGPTDKTQTNAVTTLRDDVKPLLSGTNLKVGITGSAAQQLDSQKSGNKAEAIVGIATIGLIIVLLLVIFRSPVVALLPVITIGVVSQVANGLIAICSKAFNLKADSSINEILIVVLFGIGTDYILFLMFRYRERLRAGEDAKQAMVSAVTRVGEAIASAAGAVIIAFLALTLSSLGLFKSMGPSLAIAVAVTLLAGLTLIPAVVSLLGTKVFWPSKAWRSAPTSSRAAAVGRALGRRPGLFAGGAGLVMVLLAIGALGFKANFDLGSSSLPKNAESTVALADLQRGFPAGSTEPTSVFLQEKAGTPLDKSTLAAFATKLEAVHGVGQVTGPQLSKDGSVANYSVILSSDPSSSTAIHTIAPLRTAAHAAAPPGTTALVGGLTAVFADIQHAMDHDYLIVFPVAAVLIMIILGLLLRSLVAPWYLMASVGLGFAATLGATVLLFQNVHGDPGLLFILPVFMYLFVVALGTDYNILMIARLREEAREGHSPREAAALALRHAGPTIAAAGVILAGTFASLLLAGNDILSEMGFAVSFGIVIAAFVMAMFFTPAITALIGHRAWWPGHQDRAAHQPDAAREPVQASAGR
ncbi:MMPL family transporter [Rugosimonospora acidiphila]|uniref:MMPL family transporter n=1 Tax=Rugosimonospora acidiphila TaxID=556531 RepID=A0ABP9SPG7_9ACTN